MITSLNGRLCITNICQFHLYFMTTRFLHYAIFVFDDCSDPNCFYSAGFSTKTNLLFDINLTLLNLYLTLLILYLTLFISMIANYRRFDYQPKTKSDFEKSTQKNQRNIFILLRRTAMIGCGLPT